MTNPATRALSARSEQQGFQGKNSRFTKFAGVAIVLCALTTMAAAQFKNLDSFAGTNGANPQYMTFVQGTDGDFYGTAETGGSGGQGVIFLIKANGTYTVLHNFCQLANCTDGAQPYSGMIQDTNGIYYGTTWAGGANNAGIVYSITQKGVLTVLYNFCSLANCADGEKPAGGLVQGSNGVLYGTTSGGGKNGAGTIFEINTAGKFKTVYNFCSLANCADGSTPYATLIQANNGTFYGTTTQGGANSQGTIFELWITGKFASFYSFCSQAACADGAVPYAGVIQALDGNLYGTTTSGGTQNAGAVYKITTTGTFNTIYSFCSVSCADGETPYAGVIQGTDGNLYGTTYAGGNGYGTIYNVSTSGAFNNLYTFCAQSGCPDGQQPTGGLIQGTDGVFFGTTSAGGKDGGFGTIFELSMGLQPFVALQTTSGKVGASVIILGSNLVNVSGVSFNGTPANFSVNRSTEIKSQVPAGATTGTVTVTMGTQTLKSNVPFIVLP